MKKERPHGKSRAFSAVVRRGGFAPPDTRACGAVSTPLAAFAAACTLPRKRCMALPLPAFPGRFFSFFAFFDSLTSFILPLIPERNPFHKFFQRDIQKEGRKERQRGAGHHQAVVGGVAALSAARPASASACARPSRCIGCHKVVPAGDERKDGERDEHRLHQRHHHERNSRFAPQPSMRAASMKLVRGLTMNCRTRNTPNAFRMGTSARCGRVHQPQVFDTVNTGLSVTCPASSMWQDRP